MTDKLREAAQAALDVLNTEVLATHACDKIEKILRAALAEQEVEQEPVAWIESPGMIRMNPLHKMALPSPLLDWKIALYTAPPRREWVSLTDEEIEDLYFDGFSLSKLNEFARAIETALKEKNHEAG